jgi:hypothetical protein
MINRYVGPVLCATLGLLLVSAQGFTASHEANSVSKTQLASVPGPPIPDPNDPPSLQQLASVPGPPIPDPNDPPSLQQLA